VTHIKIKRLRGRPRCQATMVMMKNLSQSLNLLFISDEFY
jgi:hypothetical protein